MSHVQPPPFEPWCVHFQHAALSLLSCPQQPMQSRFLRSPGHPYRSDVMVAKPPRRGQAHSPAADRRRLSAHDEPGDGLMHSPQVRFSPRSQPRSPRSRRIAAAFPSKPCSKAVPQLTRGSACLRLSPQKAPSPSRSQQPRRSSPRSRQRTASATKPQQASRKQPPVKRQGAIISPRSLRAYFPHIPWVPELVGMHVREALYLSRWSVVRRPRQSPPLR